jgi:putative ABC transport system permease protein
MTVLTHKLFRDLLRSGGVLVTIVAIITVGIGSFVGLGSAQRILENSQIAYYNEFQFADFWVDLKKAPLSAVEPIAEFPGVASIETRVTFDVILDLPGVIQPIHGRLISTPARGFDKTLNGICVIRGSGFSDDRNEEVILGEEFAKKHRLDPGDRIALILNRKREEYTIVGTAISPEYVYMVRGEGDFVPDPEHFGILYIKESYARDVLDFQDACNQIIGKMVPGTTQDVNALLDRIDRRLDPYGVLATVPRERQASHRFLSDEIMGLGVSATIMPAILLFVAALVLNVLMARLAERQRTIIGTLKAIGYSNIKIFIHFLSFGLFVGLIGGIAGVALGTWMAASMIDLYREFFQFPTFIHQNYLDLIAGGIGISLAFATAGTAQGVRAVLRLAPAEAMRPKPPERGGAVFLERFPLLWRSLSFRTHMAIRGLFRNRFRTSTGVISSAFATSILLLTLIMYDSAWYMLDFQFNVVAHSDVDVGMRDEQSLSALLEGRDLPGVDYAEPILGLVCDVRHGRYVRRLSITGLSADHRLTTPMQADLTPIEVPEDGLVLSEKLAEILSADVGARLELTPIRGRRRTVTVPVRSVVEGFIGLECYADIRYISRVVGEAYAANALQFAVNPEHQNDLYAAIKKLPNAQGLSVRADTRGNLESTFIKSMTFSLGMMILCAGVISFGSVLNASLIEIGDRLRDISTFRVLGYRPAQIAAILYRQNMLIFAAGTVIALPLTYVLVNLLATAYNTELFRMPVVFRPLTILLSLAMSFAFVLIAQIFVYRKIQTLNWLEGVQVKE